MLKLHPESGLATAKRGILGTFVQSLLGEVQP
jgi:hypothetical protein